MRSNRVTQSGIGSSKPCKTVLGFLEEANFYRIHAGASLH